MTSNRISRFIGRVTSRGIMIIVLTLLGFFVSPISADSRIVRVGVYENAPKVFTDKSGNPAGIFIEILEYIAEEEGWQLEYVHGTWDEGLRRLENGEIDLMPDVAFSTSRGEIFDFHQVPVLSDWFQVYARKGSGIQSIVDLGGKRIAVLERSVQQEAFEQLADGFELAFTLLPMPDYQTIFERVAAGEADAAITNRFYGLMHVREFDLEDTAIIFHPTNLFYATTRGSGEELLNTIDKQLTQLKEDHESVYYKTLRQWTSEDVSFSLPAWVKIAGLVIGSALLISLMGGVLLERQVNTRTKAFAEQNVKMHNVNQALRDSERRYRELLEHANSIIVHWTHDGRITFLNEFGQRFFGYAEGEILGQHVVGTIVPESESDGRDLRPLMAQIAADPVAYEQNVNENMRRTGERVWIAWTNKVYFDDQGQIERILSIGTDITRQRQADEALRRLNAELEQRVVERTADLAAAMEKAQAADHLKSAFLATMSHELRTPLNSIIGFTGILLQDLAGPLNKEQQKQLRMVQTSARHLLALINDVLDISKIEAGQLELSRTTFDLRTSIEETVSLVLPMAEKKGLDLRVEIADDVTDATTDQRRMEQIILNLLNNAVKFTEKGYIRLSCQVEDDQYVLSVIDTGIGIKSENITGLFKPFHQIDTGLSRKREGTGLGLSICKKLITLMGGDIDVQSQWEQGSTFTIRFPIRSGAL